MPPHGVSNFRGKSGRPGKRRQLMKRYRLATPAVVAATAFFGFAAACAAGSPAREIRPDSSTIVHRAAGQDEDLPVLLPEPPIPLWIETGDLGFGSSVVFRH